MKFFSNISTKFLTKSSSALLLIVIFTIFFIPIFSMHWHKILYNISFTFIFLLSALALSRYRTKVFNAAILVIFIEWFSEILNLSVLTKISLLVNIFFFILIVMLFIFQIAQARTVTPRVIFESINGYLMLGLSFSILISLLCVTDPNSFSFKHLSEQMNPSITFMSNYVYYGLITLTTIGYGDVVPLTSAAKSLSTFIGISGQMYIAIIIAALVSKYLGQKSKND